jgi:hypothetical protein
VRRLVHDRAIQIASLRTRPLPKQIETTGLAPINLACVVVFSSVHFEEALSWSFSLVQNITCVLPE